MGIFSLNQIVVIQSLEPHESQTGQHMANFIDAELERIGSDLRVELVDCESAYEFEDLMKSLEKEGQLGMRPIIHIECHGDASDGLEFANGSELSWDRLEKCFTQLNLATRLNTIAIVSACFGAYFISRATPILPAPFFALISPTDEINAYEIKTGLEGFYQSFLSQTSIDDALVELKNRKLLKGSWFSMSAEQLFVENLTLYIQEFCSRRASIERAKKINDAWASEGKPRLSQNNIFKMLRNRHKNIESEAFNTFFCIDKIPENSWRFKDSLIEAKKNISRIRAEGRHII